MIKSYCGMLCEQCVEYPLSCQGCNKTAGFPRWVSEYENRPCPFYKCCVMKQLSCCSECHELICDVKRELEGE